MFIILSKKTTNHCWISVIFMHRVMYKLCLLMYYIHTGHCAQYLHEAVLLISETQSRHGLRSTDNLQYEKPKMRTVFWFVQCCRTDSMEQSALVFSLYWQSISQSAVPDVRAWVTSKNESLIYQFVLCLLDQARYCLAGPFHEVIWPFFPLVSWGLALCRTWYLSLVRYSVKCVRSISVCDSSPLGAISFSDQLVPAQFHSWHDLCMRSSYFSCNLHFDNTATVKHYL